MGGFKDKAVFITGASSGIGAGLAKEFADRGASLVLTARRGDRLQALSEELKAGGGKALAVACDVTKDGDQEAAVEAALAEFGRIDVSVANAVFGVGGTVDSLGLEDFRRQFETNVYGVLRTFYATIEQLKKNRGTLVLMGSVSGHLSGPTTGPYAMSKYAVRAFAEALHGELEPSGVRTVLISPGFVESEIRKVDRKGKVHPDAKDAAPPWLVMSTKKAARQMVDGIEAGNRELVITAHGKLAVFLNNHFRPLISLAMRKSYKGRKKGR